MLGIERFGNQRGNACIVTGEAGVGPAIGEIEKGFLDGGVLIGKAEAGHAVFGGGHHRHPERRGGDAPHHIEPGATGAEYARRHGFIGDEQIMQPRG